VSYSSEHTFNACSVVYDKGLLQYSPNVGQQIRQATNDHLSMVFDTVSNEATASIRADAFRPEGGVYYNLLGVECPRSNIESVFFLGYCVSGEDYTFEGETYLATPEDFVHGAKFASFAEKLWAEWKWKPHPQKLEKAGLSGVSDGLQQKREERYSGEKLVYRIEETRWP
jgi:hypothetical protein